MIQIVYFSHTGLLGSEEPASTAFSLAVSKDCNSRTIPEIGSRTFVTETKDASTNTDPLPRVCIYFIGTVYIIFLTVTLAHCRILL